MSENNSYSDEPNKDNNLLSEKTKRTARYRKTKKEIGLKKAQIEQIKGNIKTSKDKSQKVKIKMKLFLIKC